MGVEYDLNDPAKGESFDFGKGWHGVEGRADYDRAPLTSGPGHCQYHAHRGPPYRWTPLASRDETLHYVTSHFYFLETIGHSDGCARIAEPESPQCSRHCEFQEPDLEYANELADRLWTWLEGRDQSQLDITDDCSGDDIHCDPSEHDNLCEGHAGERTRYGERHFYQTGSRYSNDWISDKK